MPISNISLSNTFFQWLAKTNELVNEVNKTQSGDYTKSSNTFYITSPGIGLSVVNTAVFGTVSANSLSVSANANFANLSINGITANSGIFTNFSTVGNTISLSISTPRRNTSIVVNRGESANSANADAILRWNESSKNWEIRDVNSSNNYFRLPSSNNTRFGIGTPNPSTSLHIVANDAIILPSGTVAQRPAGVNGMIRYNSNTNLVEAYANNQWGSVGGSDMIRQTFIATANQTSFVVAGSYSPGMIDVFYNGIKLVNGTDVNVSTGNTVILTTGAVSGAVVDVIAYTSVSIIDAVRKSGDTMTGALYASSFSGDGANLTSITVSNINASGTTNSTTFLSGDAVWRQIDLSSLDANNVIYGTVSSERLGSGTANANTYLAGDGSWKPVISGATLENDVSSNTVYYIGMTDSSSGTWSNAYVSDTKLYFNTNTGTLSATIFNSLSDKELKENFESIENSLEIINKVNPIGFNWKGSGKKSYGVIAQELEQILPELVSDNNGIKSVEYNSLMAFLIGAVQEMSERLDKLENK